MKLTRSIFMGVTLILFAVIFSEGVFAATAGTSTSAASVQFTSVPGAVLKLDSVPALNFGEQVYPASDQNYASLTVDPLVQVTDDRGSTEATGWNVTVSATPFTTSSGKILTGAEITFSSSGSPVQNPDLGSAGPTTPASFVITPDGSGGTVAIITAANGAGRGTWETTWPKANVALHVPGGIVTSGLVYTSTLTWTLSDTP